MITQCSPLPGIETGMDAERKKQRRPCNSSGLARPLNFWEFVNFFREIIRLLIFCCNIRSGLVEFQLHGEKLCFIHEVGKVCAIVHFVT